MLKLTAVIAECPSNHPVSEDVIPVETFKSIYRASNGSEAIRMVIDLMPDILLADSILPVVDGLTLCERLSSMPLMVRPGIILILHGNISSPRVDALRENGCEFISKPFTSDDLKLAIDKLHPFKRRIDSNIYDKLDKLLDTIGIPEHDGRLYLCKAIILSYLDFRYVHSLTSRLYPDVGSIFGCTSARVERAMRYVIEQAWKLGRIDEQYKIFGGTIDAQRGKPTCGEMIAQIAGILRMEGSK